MNDNNFSNFPWCGNGIYLEDAKKQIKAVCSNDELADKIAKVVNQQVAEHGTRNVSLDCGLLSINGEKIKEFIKASYILYVTLPKAKIQVNDISTMFLEKAYHDFHNSFSEILKDYHIDLKDKLDNLQK